MFLLKIKAFVKKEKKDGIKVDCLSGGGVGSHFLCVNPPPCPTIGLCMVLHTHTQLESKDRVTVWACGCVSVRFSPT